MIHVDFNPASLQGTLKAEWDAWLQKSEEAVATVVGAWETWKTKHNQTGEAAGKFDPGIDKLRSIWSQLKEWLLTNVFHEKCAYCESRLTRLSGHAEHFRPKGRVKDKSNNHLAVVQTVDELGISIDHPGYFWLAFNWKNLLPSCEKCNTGEGKKDQFPTSKSHILMLKLTRAEVTRLKASPIPSTTWRDFYYLQPEDLDDLEGPLLLHPYFDKPREHLIFGDFGFVTARDNDPKGSESIKVYNLDDPKLNIDRQVYQERAMTRYFGALSSTQGAIHEKRQKADEAIEGFTKGLEPFSAAAIDYLKLFT